jgi:PRTase ComF-like
MLLHHLELFELRTEASELYANSLTGEAFDPAQYSLLKYGSASAAERWGELLAARLLQIFGDDLLSESAPIITASAFHQVPTAAFAVTLTTRAVLDRVRAERDLTDLAAGRIVRDRVYEGEYESLSADDRHAIVRSMGLSYQGPSLEGKHLIVVDDIRVSGAHEQVLIELLSAHLPAAITFAYLVRVDAAQGQADATIEQRLNNWAIGSIDALRELIRSEPTLLNARVVKRILLWPRTHEALSELLADLPDTVLSRLYKAALADGYHRMPAFQGAFARVEAVMQERLSEDFPRVRLVGDDPAVSLAQSRLIHRG